MMRGNGLIAVVLLGLLGMGTQVRAQPVPPEEPASTEVKSQPPITGTFLWASDLTKLKKGVLGEALVESEGLVRSFGFYSFQTDVTDVLKTLKVGDSVRLTPQDDDRDDARLESIALEKKAAGCACPSASASEASKQLQAEGRVVHVTKTYLSLEVPGKKAVQQFKVKADNVDAMKTLQTLKINDRAHVTYSVEGKTKVAHTLVAQQEEVAPKEIELTGVVTAASESELELQLPDATRMTFKPDPEQYGINYLLENLNTGMKVRITYREDTTLGRLVTSVEENPKDK
ncbi:MAG: hypothetical protein EOO71_25520 [Myxococcaceae bacterium]|nr:MAG: hypothetical protein EOO71_25520 [Myxococcaceae bacterium]